MKNENEEIPGYSSEIKKLYKVHYFNPGENTIFEAPKDHSYFFRTFLGQHKVHIEHGDCVYFLSAEKTYAILRRGPCEIESQHCATIVRGFMPADSTCSLAGSPLLPYINGCSTKQIFPPPRIGDPTLQYLHIPPYSTEQTHHVHSTVRVVYTLSGRGNSVVGMKGATIKEELISGKVSILEPMCPHHFETPYGEPLAVIPLHVYSSIPGETVHPMFSGTHLMNQGS
uniref:Cupin domain-containing protein n=1 Tax=Candidatus Kentrum sp. SD TaxID=2126332 RepID=A0A450Y8W4_9GAMM|nr:MAG: hypothetical protein BECKSD772F_GA0070984_101936 [Candidatus Kentron sp. SD]VFK42621.1 MAG: hypothetical protein BECKSD772E_GA0070983_101837 [Candidatus Kentron sp. SD]